MKTHLHPINHNTRINLAFLMIIAISMLLVIFFGSVYTDKTQKIDYEYYKDVSGSLTITNICASSMSNCFQKMDHADFNAGISDAVWWIRFKTDTAGADENILVIDNHALANAILYLPGDNGYTKLNGGWAFGSENNMSDSYVTFNIPATTTQDQYIYLRMESPYSLTSSFSLLSQDQFSYLNNHEIFLKAIILGLFFAMLINCMILQFKLHDRIAFSIFVLIGVIILYVINNFGFGWVLFARFSPWYYSSGLCLAVSFLILFVLSWFIKLFLNVKENYPINNIVFHVYFVMCYGGVLLIATNHIFRANQFATFLFIVMITYTMLLTGHAVIRGITYARYLFYAIIVTFLGHFSLLLGFWGLESNKFVITYMPAISWWLATVVVYISIGEHIRSTREEKEIEIAIMKNVNERNEEVIIAVQKAQINKQLLFNAMEVSSALCTNNADKAVDIMLNLSDYLNFCFDFDGKAKLRSFSDTIKELDTYVRLRKETTKINFTLGYQLNYTNPLLVPPLLLQPLVENAIVHGFKGKNSGKIIVSVTEHPDQFLLSVADNGVGMPEETVYAALHQRKSGETPGLIDINEIVLHFFGKPLEIKSKLYKGTVITITIPKRGETDNESDIS